MSEEWETEEGENRQKQRGEEGREIASFFLGNGGGREMKSWRPTLDFL